MLSGLGIGPHERPLHHYRLLGLELFEADAGKISAAADERMMLLRQYQTGPRGTYTQKLLNEVAAAPRLFAVGFAKEGLRPVAAESAAAADACGRPALRGDATWPK
jgi:hypothetical protein